jgi:hypothetical protein
LVGTESPLFRALRHVLPYHVEDAWGRCASDVQAHIYDAAGMLIRRFPGLLVEDVPGRFIEIISKAYLVGQKRK